MEDSHGRITTFNKKAIRRTFYYGEWWFVINDVVAALTGSEDPNQYVEDLRAQNAELENLFQKGDKGIAKPQLLSIESANGYRRLGCWNVEALFRLVSAMPVSSADTFKRWLARVGYERISRSDDPEVAAKKARALYRSRGYSESWIARRLKAMAVREELVAEWSSRGIRSGLTYRTLTNQLAKSTFGLTPSEHRRLKKLTHQNLRDHMTELELVFSMLGEVSTTEIVRIEDAHGFMPNYLAAKRGGRIAGTALRKLERETGRRAVTAQNHLPSRVNNRQLKLATLK